MTYKVGDIVIAVKQYDDDCPYRIDDELIVTRVCSSMFNGIEHMRIETKEGTEWNVPHDCVRKKPDKFVTYKPSKRQINVVK